MKMSYRYSLRVLSSFIIVSFVRGKSWKLQVILKPPVCGKLVTIKIALFNYCFDLIMIMEAYQNVVRMLILSTKVGVNVFVGDWLKSLN